MKERLLKLATLVLEWMPLPSVDVHKVAHFIRCCKDSLKFQLFSQNIPVLVEMQICSIFNPDLMWKDQVTPLIGQEEVGKLDRKLRSLNVTGFNKSSRIAFFSSNQIQFLQFFDKSVKTLL